MNKTVLVSTLAFFVAGCACIDPRDRMPDPSYPAVSIVDDEQIVVNQEPLFFKERKKVTITWQLPSDSKYTFPEGDADLKHMKDGKWTPGSDGEIVDCKPKAKSKGLEFTCENKHTKAGTYKYTIRVIGPGKKLELDPTIVNY